MIHWASMACFYLRRDAAGAAAWASENGFSGIEVWGDVPFLHSDETSSVDIKNLISAGRGIRYSLHGPIYGVNLSCVNPGILKESMRQTLKTLEWAGELGAERMVIHPGTSPTARCDVKDMVRKILDSSISKLSKAAGKAGVELLLENAGLRAEDTGYSLEEFRGILEDHGIGCCLDAGHANLTWGASAAVSALGPMIKQFHISDNSGENDEHLPAGSGTVEWEEYGKLSGVNNIPLVHEVQGSEDPERGMIESRGFIEKCFT